MLVVRFDDEDEGLVEDGMNAADVAASGSSAEVNTVAAVTA
jgi:hypothetical protein